MAAKKKAAKKKAAKKKAAAAPKKKAPKKGAAAAPKKKAATKAAAKKKSPPKISSMDINLGHVFKLKPRVNTSFRQNDFMTAKRALRDESYESVSDAARAVAEEALSLTRGDSARIDTNPRR